MQRRSSTAGRQTHSRLERWVIVHVGILATGSAWYLGGNTSLAATLLSAWGSLSLIILSIAVGEARKAHQQTRQKLKWLWPLAAINALVIASCFNPTFREVSDGARTLFVEDPSSSLLPSSARPIVSWHALWFFDATYLSCFNLLLSVRQRRSIRVLLAIVLTNTLLLAVFGTMQKLIGAKGLFFGLVESPQLFFFASFYYHNHWGAYVVLMMATALGFLFRNLGRDGTVEVRNSPAFALILAIVALAATLPLSGSRSCTIMGLTLIAWAVLHWILRMIRTTRKGTRSVALPLSIVPIAVILSILYVYHLGQPMITHRLETTSAQISEMKGAGSLGSRAVLYRDTWNMAREKLAFGWGMGSYPLVFFQRNTQRFSHKDGLPMYFEDAHSDWLQSFSELGLVGSGLIGLCAFVPLYCSRRTLARSSLSTYALGGCALLVLYAWLEFPFGNRAVVIAFWLCFFSAVAYGRIEPDKQVLT